MATNNSINTNGVPLTLSSGTGALTLSSDNSLMGVVVGFTVVNVTTTSALYDGLTSLNIGTSALVGPVTIGSTGGTATSVSINSNTGGVNIGTNAIAKPISIGNVTGTTSLALNSGTGAITIGTSIAKTITIGNTTGATALVLNSGTNGQVNTTTNGVFTVATGTGTVSISADATANTVNIGTGSGVKTVTIGSTTTTSPTVIRSGSGGITLNNGSGNLVISPFTTTGALVSNASGVITDASASTAGFVLTSNGASTPPSFQAAGGGGGGFTWNNVTGSSQAMSINNGYVDNGSGTPTVFTLPSTAAVGSIVAVQGNSSGLFSIAQNSGQIINFNSASTSVGVSGSLSALTRYNSIYLICTVADTDWVCNQSVGTFNTN